MVLQFGSRFSDMSLSGVAEFSLGLECFSTKGLRSFAPPGRARRPSPHELFLLLQFGFS
jgi:hypothetical protein